MRSKHIIAVLLQPGSRSVTPQSPQKSGWQSITGDRKEKEEWSERQIKRGSRAEERGEEFGKQR